MCTRYAVLLKNWFCCDFRCLSQNLFWCNLRTFVWRKSKLKIAYVEKEWQIWGMHQTRLSKVVNCSTLNHPPEWDNTTKLLDENKKGGFLYPLQSVLWSTFAVKSKAIFWRNSLTGKNFDVLYFFFIDQVKKCHTQCTANVRTCSGGIIISIMVQSRQGAMVVETTVHRLGYFSAPVMSFLFWQYSLLCIV